MELTNTAIVCFGSNVSASRIEEAIRLANWHIRRQSAIYRSDNSDYSNLVAEIATELTLEALTAQTKAIEQRMGRRHDATGEVAIDIDIVVYNGEIIRSRDYTSPYFIKGLTHLR